MQACITEWLNEHGDLIPSVIEEGCPIPLPFGQAMAGITVLVDYGAANLSVPEMLFMAKRVDLATGGIAYGGGKGNSQRYRKYVLAENGVPIYGHPKANPKRSANQRSQLLRSIKKETFLVAVVEMTTQTGVLITPSGLKKQEVPDGAFLAKIVPEEEEGFIPTAYPNWAGNARVTWVGDAKRTCRIGKLLDTLGNKFVPRAYAQGFVLGEPEDYMPTQYEGAFAVSNPLAGREVDLIIPIHELAKKGCLSVMLENAQWGTMLIGEREVTCQLVEHTFFRSGTASENDPARTRRANLRGTDGVTIRHTAKRLGIEPERDCDFAIAVELVNAVKARRIAQAEG